MIEEYERNMSMDHSGGMVLTGGKLNYSETNLSQCHFFRHKSHM